MFSIPSKFYSREKFVDGVYNVILEIFSKNEVNCSEVKDLCHVVSDIEKL